MFPVAQSTPQTWNDGRHGAERERARGSAVEPWGQEGEGHQGATQETWTDQELQAWRWWAAGRVSASRRRRLMGSSERAAVSAGQPPLPVVPSSVTTHPHTYNVQTAIMPWTDAGGRQAWQAGRAGQTQLRPARLCITSQQHPRCGHSGPIALPAHSEQHSLVPTSYRPPAWPTWTRPTVAAWDKSPRGLPVGRPIQ